MAFAPVNPPPTSPARFGLVAAAQNPDGAGERWEDGYAFAPDTCSFGGVDDPCNIGTRTPPERPGIVESEPFLVWASDECSTFGFAAEDYQARARRLLERCQSKMIAAELWDGEMAASAGWPNKALIDSTSDTVTNGGVTPAVALGSLEQYLADVYCGRGMIHASPQLVTAWAAESLVRREGSLLLTILDTIVVTDGGYSGDGPGGVAAGATQWAYATGLVAVRLGPVSVVPGSFSEAVDRATNTVRFYAERPASAVWDGCAHGAAEVTLAVPLVAGVS